MSLASDEVPINIDALVDLLLQVPAIDQNGTPSCGIGRGYSTDGDWWVKFGIRIDHPLAWRVVQELAVVINCTSLNERLPAVFKPVSPPPYLNGGPRHYLSWVIEGQRELQPKALCEFLIGRLPRPVDDLSQWQMDES